MRYRSPTHCVLIHSLACGVLQSQKFLFPALWFIVCTLLPTSPSAFLWIFCANSSTFSGLSIGVEKDQEIRFLSFHRHFYQHILFGGSLNVCKPHDLKCFRLYLMSILWILFIITFCIWIINWNVANANILLILNTFHHGILHLALIFCLWHLEVPTISVMLCSMLCEILKLLFNCGLQKKV